MIGLKNMPLTSAAADLGIGAGDSLQNQVDAQIEERKKKLMAAANTSPPAGVAMSTQTAMSPMSLGLMSSTGGGM